MIDLGFPISAFALTFLLTTRSLGWGISAVIGVGYMHGLIKANYPGTYSLFMYDSSMAGLYLAYIINYQRYHRNRMPKGLAGWCQILIAWPTLMALIPVNSLYTQALAWRMTVWYVPMALIATQCVRKDIVALCRSLAVLNLFSLSVGIYLYVYGIESLYPENEATVLIYRSADIAGGNYRIPANFIASGIYGGTMCSTLPFLLGFVLNRDRPLIDVWLAIAGILAAVGGIVMCGARSPVIITIIFLTTACLLSGFSKNLVAILLAILALGALTVLSNERFQRILTVDNTELITGRMYASMNEGFFDLVVEYPGGAGMGTPISGENEYSRILVDQGLVGLALWLGFIAWLATRFLALRKHGNQASVLIYSYVVMTMCFAFIGTGAFGSIPSSALLMIQIARLVVDSEAPRDAPP